MKDYLLFPFKVLRYLFWFVNVSSWNWWKVAFLHGPRFMVFRNRRYANGVRMYTFYRWGIAILGLEIGDRGCRREHVRERLFGPRKSKLQAEIARLQQVLSCAYAELGEAHAKVQYLVDHLGQDKKAHDLERYDQCCSFTFPDGDVWFTTAHALKALNEDA